jgi:hypothetical protein
MTDLAADQLPHGVICGARRKQKVNLELVLKTRVVTPLCRLLGVSLKAALAARRVRDGP